MKPLTFAFGDWQVNRSTNSLHRDELRRQMEPRVMDVLVALCERADTVVSADELLQQCWGSTLPGDNPIHKTITQLRRLLGDSAASPAYIETIRKRGYRAIAPVVFQAIVPGWPAVSPFRGLEAFDARHAPVFFGRETATAKLAAAVAGQARAGRALVLVLGPSGSGKSSLIQAGLLPLLERECGAPERISTSVLDLGAPPEGQLFAELGAALLDWHCCGALVFEGDSAAGLGRQLAADPGRLRARVEALGLPAPARLVLFLDRFEALFALAHIAEAERVALIRALDVLAGCAHIVLLAACRNDFYPRLAEYPALMQGKEHGAHVDLAPPTAAEIARMVRLPAQAAGLHFGVDPDSQARLDDVLCQSVTASPDALPLLQYTLQELYRQRGGDGELGFAAFDRLGGVDGAIGRRAEEIIAALEQAQRAALPRVLALLVAVAPASDALASRRARWADLHSAAERALVTALVDARLLVSELVGTEPGFGVAHEALLRRWPRATEWIAAHRGSLLIRARVGALAARWAGAGRPLDLLLPPGQQLDEASAMLAQGALALSADEAALVRASASKARLRERLRFAVMSLIVVLALLATGLGLTALAAQRAAERRRADAENLVQFMLGELAEKLRPLARLDLLDSVSTRALASLAGGDGADRGGAGIVQRARALHVIGEVRVARGDPAGAQTAFHRAQGLLQGQLDLRPNDAGVLLLLGTNAYWLGQIELDRNKLPAAGAHFQRYLAYSDRLFALDPERVDYWVEQSYAHNNLGTLAMRRGDRGAAIGHFERSIELKSRALARRPGDSALVADLADSLSWVGETRQSDGQLAGALALYERELALVAALHAAVPADSMRAYRRARALQHRAGVLLVLGRTRAAAQDYGLSEQLLAHLLTLEPGNRDWQRDLALVQMEQLRLRSYGAQGATDLAAHADVTRRLSDLVRLDPDNIDWTQLAAVARQRQGAALIGLRQHAAAREALAQAGGVLQDLHRRDRRDRRHVIALAQNRLLEARLKRGAREHAGAAAACGEARTMLRPLAADSRDYKVLDPWVRAHLCLDQPEIVSAAMNRLSDMGYREAAYAQYLSKPE